MRVRWSNGVLAMVIRGVAAPGFGIRAFARKYNLRCADCHETWPKLNNFGQTFKDNDYQLMTRRDAPIHLSKDRIHNAGERIDADGAFEFGEAFLMTPYEPKIEAEPFMRV